LVALAGQNELQVCAELTALWAAERFCGVRAPQTWWGPFRGNELLQRLQI